MVMQRPAPRVCRCELCAAETPLEVRLVDPALQNQFTVGIYNLCLFLSQKFSATSGKITCALTLRDIKIDSERKCIWAQNELYIKQKQWGHRLIHPNRLSIIILRMYTRHAGRREYSSCEFQFFSEKTLKFNCAEMCENKKLKCSSESSICKQLKCLIVKTTLCHLSASYQRHYLGTATQQAAKLLVLQKVLFHQNFSLQ